MPYPSIYKTDNGRSLTPDQFITEYNKYPTIDITSTAMSISKNRLSVIACRLRKRGRKVRKHVPYLQE